MSFKTNYSESTFRPLQNCEHEFIVEDAGISPDGSRATLTLIVRNDVEQPDQNRRFLHSIYKKREPNELDASVDGFSFANVNNISEACELEDGSEFETFAQWLACLPGYALRSTIKTEPYNGKEYQRAGFFSTTKHPNIKHVWKDQSAPAKNGEFVEVKDDDNPFIR